MDTNEMISMYVQLRDKVDEIKERHKADLEPLLEGIALLETALLNKLNAEGLKSIKSEAGTAYTRELKSVKIVDWDQTLDYIKNNERWDLLTKKIRSDGDEELNIPGTEVDRILKISVRRSQ
jgi:hypothetical protein